MWTMLRVAASGIAAQQYVVDVAANNLANVQTAGFKALRANPVDVAPAAALVGVPGESGGLTPTDREVGQGVLPGGTLGNFGQGSPFNTGQALDVAIAGPGFIPVVTRDGGEAFTRDGALKLDGDGRIVTASGALLTPEVTLPPGAAEPLIAADGTVTARVGRNERQVIGRIQLVRFANAEGLERVGSNLYRATATAGDAITGAPGTSGMGSLITGSLEASNVDEVQEFVRILQSQRAYQANLRALRTADELLQEANNLRR